MGKLVISENVTLDGVVQDATGEDGFKFGGWFNDITDRDREAWAGVLLEEAQAAQALLLGRRTEEWFAGRWLTRSGAWADRLNGMPKYVVSSTIDAPRWSNARVLKGDVVDEVAKLRRALDGEIVVYGSTRLVPTLVEHDLVDEVRLIVYPVVVGGGDRLFREMSDRRRLRLVQARAVGENLALLGYERVRDAQ